MDKKTALDYRYLRMADIWAENSYCARRKVGALIVKDKRIIRTDTMGRRRDSKMSVRTKTG